MNNKVFHLVVRFSDNLFGVGDVVAKHNEVVLRNGYVWFGKMGSTLSVNRIEMLNLQIAQNIPTFIYLVKGNRKKSTAYQAPLIGLAKQLSESETNKIPEYYAEKELVQYMKAWFKIGEIKPVEMSTMSNMRTLNSILPIQETLVLSSSGYFLIHESKNIF